MAADRFVVDGREYPVPENLSLGEAADIEEIAGVAFNQLAPGSARMMLGLLYVAMRQSDPAVTVADVRDLNISAVDFVEEEGKTGPPGRKKSRDSGKTRDSSGRR